MSRLFLRTVDNQQPADYSTHPWYAMVLATLE